MPTSSSSSCNDLRLSTSIAAMTKLSSRSVWLQDGTWELKYHATIPVLTGNTAKLKPITFLAKYLISETYLLVPVCAQPRWCNTLLPSHFSHPRSLLLDKTGATITAYSYFHWSEWHKGVNTIGSLSSKDIFNVWSYE